MSPYWGLYLESLGFNPREIGVLVSIPFLTKLVAPNFWSWLSDKYSLRIVVIRCGLFCAFLFFSGVFFYSSFYSLLVLLLLFGIFSNAILPQVEALTLSYLRYQPQSYSKIRLWGSVGFIGTVLLLGIVFEFHEISWLPFCVLAAMLLAFITSFSLTKVEVICDRNEKGSFLSLLLNKYVIVFYVVLFFLQFSHGAYYAFFSIYLENLNYPKSIIGLLWALAVICEIFIFFKIPAIFSRYSKINLLSFSLLLTVLRWVLIGRFASNIYMCILAQILHAFSFGMVHALAIDFIKSTFGETVQGQAQAFYSAVSFGAGASLGALIAGYIWHISPELVFIGSAFSALIAWLLTIAILKPKMNNAALKLSS